MRNRPSSWDGLHSITLLAALHDGGRRGHTFIER